MIVSVIGPDRSSPQGASSTSPIAGRTAVGGRARLRLIAKPPASSPERAEQCARVDYPGHALRDTANEMDASLTSITLSAANGSTLSILSSSYRSATVIGINRLELEHLLQCYAIG